MGSNIGIGSNYQTVNNQLLTDNEEGVLKKGTLSGEGGGG